MVVREEVLSGQANFIYPREIEYNELLAGIKVETVKNDSHSHSPPYVVCLNRGLWEAQKLTDLAKLS